eukprot:552094-Rhodomonas_salina.2
MMRCRQMSTRNDASPSYDCTICARAPAGVRPGPETSEKVWVPCRRIVRAASRWATGSQARCPPAGAGQAATRRPGTPQTGGTHTRAESRTRTHTHSAHTRKTRPQHTPGAPD